MTLLRQEALVSCRSLEAKAIRKAKLFHEIQELLSSSAKFDAEPDQAAAVCTGKYVGAQFCRDSSYPILYPVHVYVYVDVYNYTYV